MKLTQIAATAATVLTSVGNAYILDIYNTNDSTVPNIFGDIAVTSNGSIVATGPTLAFITVIDPATGDQLLKATIPGVTGTFGISSTAATTNDVFVVGGNVTDGKPVPGSFALYSIPTTGDNAGKVGKIVDIPDTVVSPTGSLATVGDHAYLADSGAHNIADYEFDTAHWHLDSFNTSDPLLGNPAGCPSQSGIAGLAATANTLWFSNQVQALTGSVSIDWNGYPVSDLMKVTTYTKTQGSSSTCAVVTFGKFAIDHDGYQWITTNENSIIKADNAGSYATKLKGASILPGLTAIAFSKTVANQLYVLIKAENATGSSIFSYDTADAF